MFTFMVNTNDTKEECEDRTLTYVRNNNKKAFVLNQAIFHFNYEENDDKCEDRKRVTLNFKRQP